MRKSQALDPAAARERRYFGQSTRMSVTVAGQIRNARREIRLRWALCLVWGPAAQHPF
jgi:hypothetical protein